ncbi:MAG: HXXEE domain-containing protein [Planctomycetota bacterium]
MTAFDRLTRNWVYGGVAFVPAFVCLLYAMSGTVSAAELVVLAQLPIYLVHQYEEHDDDRFARFLDARLGGGRTVLPQTAIFVINIFGVWLLIAVAFVAARGLGAGWGLAAIYLSLLNGIIHVAQAFALRCYNPGLGTAVGLLIPAGIVGLVLIDAGLAQHAVGAGLIVVLHAAIVIYAIARRSSPDAGSP